MGEAASIEETTDERFEETCILRVIARLSVDYDQPS